ncbi:MAG: hypothetical protein WBM50_22640 [Acidimicrobiales bacterium]
MTLDAFGNEPQDTRWQRLLACEVDEVPTTASTSIAAITKRMTRMVHSKTTESLVRRRRHAVASRIVLPLILETDEDA